LIVCLQKFGTTLICYPLVCRRLGLLTTRLVQVSSRDHEQFLLEDLRDARALFARPAQKILSRGREKRADAVVAQVARVLQLGEIKASVDPASRDARGPLLDHFRNEIRRRRRHLKGYYNKSLELYARTWRGVAFTNASIIGRLSPDYASVVTVSTEFFSKATYE
jgi:hypothetical protein